MAQLLPLRPDEPDQIPTSFFPTRECFWTSDLAGNPVWARYTYGPAGDVPEGAIVQTIAGRLSNYQIVTSRWMPPGVYACCPLDVPGTWLKVNAPVPQATFPAEPGRAIIGDFERDPQTGEWNFTRWEFDSWDTFPTGYNPPQDSSEAQILQVVFARSRPDGTIIPIPMPTSQWEPPPPPPPPPPPGSGGGGDGGGDGDELTLCCAAIVTALGVIATELGNLQPGGDGGGGGKQNDECCKHVVAALAEINTSLTKVAELAISGGGGGTPIDLAPLVDVVARIGVALMQFQPIAQAIETCLCTGLDSIAKAIKDLKPTDVEAIAKALEKANEMGDIPQEIIDQAVKEGVFSPEMGQLIKGSPWSHAIFAALHALGRIFGGASGEITHGFFLAVQNVVIPVGKVILNGFEEVFGGFIEGFDKYAGQHVPTILKVAKAGFDTVVNIAGEPAVLAIDFVREPLEDPTASLPGEHPDTIKRVLARAWLMGETAHALASLAGLLAYPTSRIFEGMAAQVAHAAGFDEIIQSFHGPYYRAGIARPALYGANAKFRNLLPAIGEVGNLYPRRIITEEQANTLLSFAGIHHDYTAATLSGMFTPVSPRALSAAFEDVPFPRDEVRRVLIDNGYRDNAVELLLDTLEARSIHSLRNSYLSALTTAAERGVLNDADLDASLDNLGFSDDAKRFVHLTVSTRRLQMLDELYRKSVSEAYGYGTVTDADYVAQLEAIGIDEADARAHYAVDSIKKHGKEALASLRKEISAEQKAQRAAVQAASAQFQSGETTPETFTASLIGAGVSPDLAAFALTTNQARKRGRQVLTYGTLQHRGPAAVLRLKVAAIGEQVIKKLIDLDAARISLRALEIPDANINALLARWAAQSLGEVLPV